MAKSPEKNFKNVPLTALNKSMLVLRQLDRPMLILSEEGEFRDYRGLLLHAGESFESVRDNVKCKAEP